MHEIGEDRSRCVNCELETKAAAMSDFELAAFNWYSRNVTRFVIEAGLVAELVRREDIPRPAFGVFVRALDAVHAAVGRMTREHAGGGEERADG